MKPPLHVKQISTGIGIQRGLTATPGREVVFGRNEVTLQRFHAAVDQLLGEAERS